MTEVSGNPEALLLGRAVWSGHCQSPQTDHPEDSHYRCQRNGGGSLTRMTGEFHPCPCPCHYGETFDCGTCGRPIREAEHFGADEDGDERYVHVDNKGAMTQEYCD